VICFTATQIPDIDDRLYPPELAGRNVSRRAFPFFRRKSQLALIRKHKVDLVAFSYSDVPHTEVMHKASQATAAGADFIIIGAPIP
jgi:predicted GTPase